MSVKIGYAALPTETSAALTELHRRTQQLMDMVSDTKEALENDRADMRDAASALHRQVEDLNLLLHARTQRVAIGGIRAQMFGLFLIGLGLVLQGWEISI